MAFLLELKESFKKFYNRYNTYVVPASKFIIALICFIMINTSIGYMDKLKNPVFALLLSVICAFLPGGFTLIVLSAFILIQLYVIAPEITYRRYIRSITGIVCNASDVSSVFQICT